MVADGEDSETGTVGGCSEEAGGEEGLEGVDVAEVEDSPLLPPENSSTMSSTVTWRAPRVSWINNLMIT